MKLHTQILLGLLLGAILGAALHAGAPELVPAVVPWVRPIGQIFLRLLFMLVLPLVFSALALGIAELGDLRRLGRVGAITLVYTVIVSTIAVGIGLTLVNVLRPGDGVPDATRELLLKGAAERAGTLLAAPTPASGSDLLVKVIPDNIVRAMADNDMLAVLFFSLITGIALASVRTPATAQVELLLRGVQDLAMAAVGVVIRLAPLGVGALIFAVVAELGAAALVQLLGYVVVVLLGLLIHQVVVYSAAVWFVGGMSPVTFFRGVQEAMLTAFSTSSSAATLPTSLRVADQLGLPPEVSRFVLTVGATANQNGTALFEGVTVLFLAQFYGVELTLAQQVMVAGVSVLGGIGTAGVPAGSLPVVLMLLGMVGVPPEGIGLVLGVDRVLDMCRTTLNVTGDLAAAVVVSKLEQRAA